MRCIGADTNQEYCEWEEEEGDDDVDDELSDLMLIAFRMSIESSD